MLLFGLRVVPDAFTAASGGSLLFDQYRPFANLKPKNRKPNSESTSKPTALQVRSFKRRTSHSPSRQEAAQTVASSFFFELHLILSLELSLFTSTAILDTPVTIAAQPLG
jgi:hypothetical protein